ncbi:hypothetical protein EYF80_060793 [Liparis tanakae]|uniref:Uncharacterized protein n=1 Tax=Liparis tanakae TaxID=230148 RepID=A0A4Z2EKG5_9TELE|nr:hypothetical protein EYF80_060793 [Liparis tanakae]
MLGAAALQNIAVFVRRQHADNGRLCFEGPVAGTKAVCVAPEREAAVFVRPVQRNVKPFPPSALVLLILAASPASKRRSGI